jgi:hypothetical protein
MTQSLSVNQFVDRSGLKFYFYSVITGEQLEFDAIDLDVKNMYDPTWTTQKVFGRQDPILTFSNVSRKMQISFAVRGEGEDVEYLGGSYKDYDANFHKLNQLITFLYPGYARNRNAISISASPFLKIKYGNLVCDARSQSVGQADAATAGLLCGLESFDHSYDLSGVEIPVSNFQHHGSPGYITPTGFTLSFTAVILHQHDLGFVNGSGGLLPDADIAGADASALAPAAAFQMPMPYSVRSGGPPQNQRSTIRRQGGTEPAVEENTPSAASSETPDPPSADTPEVILDEAGATAPPPTSAAQQTETSVLPASPSITPDTIQQLGNATTDSERRDALDNIERERRTELRGEGLTRRQARRQAGREQQELAELIPDIEQEVRSNLRGTDLSGQSFQQELQSEISERLAERTQEEQQQRQRSQESALLDDPSNTTVGTREDLLLAARSGADIPDNATRRERRQAEREIRSELAEAIAQGNVVVVESQAERELAVEHAAATREIRNREQTHAGILEARTIIESGSDGNREAAIDRLDTMIEEVEGIGELTTIETSSGQSVVLGEGGEAFRAGLEIERDRLQYQINVEQFDEQAVLTELQTQLAGDIDAERAEAYRNITTLQEELHSQQDLHARLPDDPLEETARHVLTDPAQEFTATEIDLATQVLAGDAPGFRYFPYDNIPDAESFDVWMAIRAIEGEMPEVEARHAGRRSNAETQITQLESTIAEEQAIIDRTSGEGLNAEIERRLPAALADARPIEPDTSVTTYFEEGRVLGQTLEEARQQLREYTGQQTLHAGQETQLLEKFEEQQALLQAANPEPILNTDQFGNLTQIVDHDFFPEQERKPVPQDDFKTNLPFQRYENIESFVQQLDEGTFDSEGYTNLTDTQFILGDEGHERQPTTFLSEMKKVTLDIQDRASLRSGGMTLEEVVGMLIAQAPELRRIDKVTENMANEIASILARTFFKDSAYVSSFSFSENSLQKAIFNVIRTS